VALTCLLAPPVFAELYAMLAEDHAQELAPRLELLEEDETWLGRMAGWYGLLWQSRMSSYESDEVLYEGMPDYHGQLATWVLSVLRGDSDDFSRTLLRRSVEVLRQAEDAGHGRSGPEGRPAVVAWSLGSRVGDYDRDFPVVFAEPAPDPNVRMAYWGLVQHLIDMGTRPEPWPEIATNSVLWRCAGIAEGLAPLAKPNLESSLNSLMSVIRELMPEGTWRDVNAHWHEFRQSRNALTHLTARDGGPCFTDVGERRTGRDDLRQTLLGATTFVASSIRSVLLDPEDDLGRRAMAETVESELSWLEGMAAA
jgi:uncharacterized protein YjiS (DUF1127 family)